jgi:hypothetical protein
MVYFMPNNVFINYIYRSIHERIDIKNNKIQLGLLVFFLATALLKILTVPFLSQHISNFYITGILLLLSLHCNLKRLISKFYFYTVLWLWVFINLLGEWLVGVDRLTLPGINFINFNTPDMVDAVFGILAVIIYGFITLKYSTKSVYTKP